MPVVYVGGKIEIKVVLTKDDEFLIKQWNDKNLAKKRKEYEKPNLGLWLELDNSDDPDATFPIPIYDLDMFEGNFSTAQNGSEFTFNFDGKAKVSVHIKVKEKIDSGITSKLHSVSINGASYSFEEPKIIELSVQSKKL